MSASSKVILIVIIVLLLLFVFVMQVGVGVSLVSRVDESLGSWEQTRFDGRRPG